MSNYSDLLKSPKWQKKRLDILSLKGFKCEICGDEENQIQVHHRFYLKGRKPWEYDNDVFQVLCEGCHEKNHKKEEVKEVVPDKYLDLISCLDTIGDVDVHDLCQFLIDGCDDIGVFKRLTSQLAFAASNGHIDSVFDIIRDKWMIENNEIGIITLSNRIIELEKTIDNLKINGTTG